LHFGFLFVEHCDVAVDVLQHRQKEFAMNFLRLSRKKFFADVSRTQQEALSMVQNNDQFGQKKAPREGGL